MKNNNSSAKDGLASSNATANIEKIYMITQDECGACKLAKNMLKEEIKKGNIIEANIDSVLGQKLLKEFDNSPTPIKTTPTLIQENKVSKAHQVCILSKDADTMKCHDGKIYNIKKGDKNGKLG